MENKLGKIKSRHGAGLSYRKRAVEWLEKRADDYIRGFHGNCQSKYPHYSYTLTSQRYSMSILAAYVRDNCEFLKSITALASFR